MASPEESSELNHQYTQNRNDIDELYLITTETKQAVLETNTKVDNLSRHVDERFDQVNGRFDRLEELLTSPSRPRVVASAIPAR